MSRVQVLVTTMHQTGFDKYTEMNLQTDAVIANQTDRNAYEEIEKNGCLVQLISTNSRGTSRNRNLALAHVWGDAEYILFSDDDLVFNDGYEESILNEFAAHPEAEAIKFNLHDLSATRKIAMKSIERVERAKRRTMSASGVCGLVVRKNVLKKHGLCFHENFGPGTENFCGEDTIFLMEMFRKKIALYRSPVDIAGIDQSESTWFQGYNEKYFIIAGMILKTSFPRVARLLAIRSAYRFSKRKTCNMRFFRILKCYWKGIRSL